MLGEAIFSPCQLYRYTLNRKIERELLDEALVPSLVTFLLLNPSTATAEVNDPTVTKCCTYARMWGFTNLRVVNIFAYRSTDPKGLKLTSDPVGPDNDGAIVESCEESGMVLCAWGRHGDLYDRGRLVTGMLLGMDIGNKLHYLNLNNDGSPTHPLYQKLDLRPRHWDTANEYGRIVH